MKASLKRLLTTNMKNYNFMIIFLTSKVRPKTISGPLINLPVTNQLETPQNLDLEQTSLENYLYEIIEVPEMDFIEINSPLEVDLELFSRQISNDDHRVHHHKRERRQKQQTYMRNSIEGFFNLEKEIKSLLPRWMINFIYNVVLDGGINRIARI